MIMITGNFAIVPSRRGEFLAFARELVERERDTPGCLAFAIYEDVTRENHFLMLEQWADSEALDHHTATPEFDQNDSALNSFIDGEPGWDEYEFDA